MIKNPLLLANLMIKHQAVAKTFEEAVAVEVAAIEKEKQAFEDELTELSNRESKITMRVRELEAAMSDLTGEVQPLQQPTPAVVETVTTTNNVSYLRPGQRTPSGGRLARTRKDGQREERYKSNNYAGIAVEFGVGTREGRSVVWLTPTEHAAVASEATSRKARTVAPLPLQVPPITLDGEVPPQALRIRSGTSTEEQFYCGKHFLQISADFSIGTRTENGVWLTKEEYATVLQAYNSARTAARRENRDSRIRGGSGSVIERKYTSREYRSAAEKNKRGTHDTSENDPCVWLTDQESDEVYLLISGKQSAAAK